MFITFLNGLFIGSGRSKLLSRAGKRQQRDMLAAVEPRDLSLTAVTVEQLHRRAGPSVLLAFFDQVTDEKSRRIYMNRERRKALQTIVDQLETLKMQLEEIQTEEEEFLTKK